MTSPTAFNGHQNGWFSVTADGGDYVLDDAWLAVFGNDATVTFNGGFNQASFTGSSGATFHETVVGDDGAVIADDASVSLTGDSDNIFLAGAADVLDLTAATPGVWSALYASDVSVNLHGASLSIVGGGVTIDAVAGQGDDAASLYQTNGVADLVIGDGAVFTLNEFASRRRGHDDAIWFESGSGSTVTVNSTPGVADTVYGAGTIDVASGEVRSVGGGALIDFQAPGELADVSFTQGVWDRVEGAGGQVNVYSAQVSVFGGNQTVNFVGGDDNAVSLYQTAGNWDAVYGVYSEVIVNSAQVNFFNGSYQQNIYLQGVGDQISLYGSPYYTFYSVIGGNSDIVLNGGFIQIAGGGDTLFMNPLFNTDAFFRTRTASGTLVYATGGQPFLSLANAQVSVVGGGVTVNSDGSLQNAVSFYNSGGNADSFNGTGEVILNDATVNVSGGQDQFSFHGATNALTVQGYNDTFNLAGPFGIDSITGFADGDTVKLLHSQFANFSAVQAALSQQGADTVLTLNSQDKATFVGVSLSAFTASTVQLV